MTWTWASRLYQTGDCCVNQILSGKSSRDTGAKGSWMNCSITTETGCRTLRQLVKHARLCERRFCKGHRLPQTYLLLLARNLPLVQTEMNTQWVYIMLHQLTTQKYSPTFPNSTSVLLSPDHITPPTTPIPTATLADVRCCLLHDHLEEYI